MEKIRLQKFFTDCGVLSRRAAEEEIKAGHVRVNGAVASLGDKIDPEVDVVEYKGRRIICKARIWNQISFWCRHLFHLHYFNWK